MIKRLSQVLLLSLFFLLNFQVTQAQSTLYHQIRRIGKGSIGDVQWSSDSSTILVTTENNIVLYSSNLKEKGSIPLVVNLAYMNPYLENLAIWSSDSSKIFYADEAENEIKIWDVKTGKVERTLRHLSSQFLALSPNGKLLANISSNESVQILDSQTGNTIKTFPPGDVRSIKWSPDSHFLAIVDSVSEVNGYVDYNNGTVQIWDELSNQIILTNNITGSAIYAWSPDSKEFAFQSNYNEMSFYGKKGGIFVGDRVLTAEKYLDNFVWNPISDKVILTDSNNLKIINAKTHQLFWEREIATFWNDGNYQWSLDGKLLFLVNAEQNNLVKILDANNGTVLKQFPLPRKNQSIWNMYLAPDNKHLLLKDESDDLYLYEIDTTRQLHSMSDAFGNVKWGNFSPDGNILAVCTDGTDIHLWDVNTGNYLKSLVNQSGSYCPGAQWSPDGQYIAGVNEGVLTIWNVKTSKIVKTISSEDVDNKFLNVSWHPDGTSLILASQKGEIRLIRFPDGKSKWVSNPYQRSVEWMCSPSWNPDGSRFVCIGNGVSAVFDGLTGKHLFDLEEGAGQDSHSEWTRDGKYILDVDIGDGGNDLALNIWDANTGKRVEAGLKNGFPFAINPDSKRIAYLFDGRLFIADFLSGQILDELKMENGYAADADVFWSPDGKHLGVVHRTYIFIFAEAESF